MSAHYTYLLVNFLTIIICFIFSFHPKIRFDRHFFAFIKAAFLVAIPFITWDVYFAIERVWWFHPNYILGVYFFGLPLEEILFFFCIPFSCVYTYFCLEKFGILKGQKLGSPWLLFFVMLLMLVVLCLNISRVYTAVAFITTFLVMLWLVLRANDVVRSKINNVYLILLIPFLLVNGVLTGTGLESAIVNYDNRENLSIRVLTIPVEDAVYAYELIALNIVVFNYFRKKRGGTPAV